jgi:aliphatic nitrilase
MTDQRTTFVAAVVQAAPVWMDKTATTAKACRLIHEAASQHGACLVAFGESFIPAFPYGVWHHGLQRNMRFYKELFEAAVVLEGSPEVAALCQAAREHNCVVVIGVTERDGGSLYNTQVFIGADGGLLGSRRKLKPTSAERLVWGEGDGSGLRLFDTPTVGRLGGLLCGEHNLALARYTLQSQQEQVHVACYPDPFMEGRPFADRVEAAVRHYAAEGQCFVLNATTYMDDDARAAIYDTPELAALLDQDPTALHGCSSIIDPAGRTLAGPLSGEEGILAAEIDLSKIAGSKFWFDPSGHSGRPDVFDLRVNFGSLAESSSQWSHPSQPPQRLSPSDATTHKEEHQS